MLIWKVPRIHEEGILLEVEHVEAHHSKQKQEMTLFERVVAGNQRADELANDGAKMNGGEMAAQIRARRKERRSTRLFSTQLAFAAWQWSWTILNSRHRRQK